MLKNLFKKPAMIVEPGYNRVPSSIIGPTVDLDYWGRIVPAGQGPVTGPNNIESVAVACMRSLPAPFNVCPGKGGW